MLNKNEIEFLLENTFGLLTSIEIITLDGNKLSFIPKKLFEHNLNLRMVNLQSNQINFISPNMFDDLAKLTYFDLSNNLCASKSYYVENFKDIVDDLNKNCSTPDVKSKYLKNLENFKIIKKKIEDKQKIFNGSIEPRSKQLVLLSVLIVLISVKQNFVMKHFMSIQQIKKNIFLLIRIMEFYLKFKKQQKLLFTKI